MDVEEPTVVVRSRQDSVRTVGVTERNATVALVKLDAVARL